MSGKPAARQSDPTSCPVPGHGTNPIATGSPNVLFDNLPAARLTDTSACGSPIVGAVINTVLINGLPAATLGSTGGHGSVIVGGSGSVIIGNSAVTAPFTAPSPLSFATAALAPAATAMAADKTPPATPLSAQPAQPAATASAMVPPAQTTDRVAAAKQIVDTFECSDSQSRVFNDRAYPMGTPHDPFEKSKVIEQLRVRVARSQGERISTKENIGPFPDQKEASLCGPAVFFFALLVDRPDLYTQAIIELWETGETTIGQLHIKPSHDCRNPKKFSHTAAGDRISAIDWISLASLRDSENDLFDYDSPGDQIPGITLPGKIRSWFTKAGASEVFSNIQYRAHINQDKFSELISYADNQHHVVSLVNAAMVEGGSGSVKNHWIVWVKPPHTYSGPVRPTTLPIEVIDHSKLFSWGRSMHQVTKGYTLKHLLKDAFGGIVLSRIP